MAIKIAKIVAIKLAKIVAINCECGDKVSKQVTRLQVVIAAMNPDLGINLGRNRPMDIYGGDKLYKKGIGD